MPNMSVVTYLTLVRHNIQPPIKLAIDPIHDAASKAAEISTPTATQDDETADPVYPVRPTSEAIVKSSLFSADPLKGQGPSAAPNDSTPAHEETQPGPADPP